MRTPTAHLTLLALLIASFGCGDDDRPTTLDGAVFRPDEDGDTIADQDEGSSASLDTDGDGTPDYLDTDSDNDGIPDAVEAGDEDVNTPPVDSDADGIPDFQDFDSDNNGIPDAREGTGDNDGDGIPDYADEDDDDDGLTDAEELMGRIDFPRDTDDDGIPDFRDPDSDNDTILDGTERLDRDTDGDGVPDREDLDSDDDGIPDSVEAGDDDLSTLPVDSDGDRLPDYRDADSDNDGLPDANEAAAGTDPTNGDTDGDGVSDLIEVGAGTDALDPADNPRANGDFVFVVPFEEPARPSRDTLLFRTNVQLADVYFLFDITGSMSGEISAMRDATIEVIERLTCEDYGMTCTSDGDCEFPADAVCSAGGRCIENPETSFCISDLWTGVGTYTGNSDEYANLLSLQEIPMLTQGAIPSSANGGGASEALYESAACVAERTECSATGCTPGGIGCPSFRTDAIRMMITLTDEDNECTSCSPNTASEAGMILVDRGVLFAGINAGTDTQAQLDLEALATAANSFNSDGGPLVFAGDADVGEEMLINAVTDAVNEVVRNVPLYVTIDPRDEPDDAGDALQFIERLETNITRPGCALLDELADVNPMDGFNETFPEVPPGERVCWDLVVRPNRTVAPTEEPQLFRATLTVTGNGSPLDRREVFFLVPPAIDEPMGEF
jgi:hypothetical protein